MNDRTAITPASLATRLGKRGKPLAFSLIIIIGFFGALELILALFGVQPLLSREDPLVGFAGNVPLFVEEVQADGSVMLRTAENKLSLFNDQAFPLVKAKHGYRIFCMGGSTTVGRPYRDKTSFCGWLREFLREVAPERQWEIINAGGVSYASYRVAKLMEEVSRYQPDLFIVYTGQNEFLEQRSYGRLLDLPDWLIDLNSAASGTRTYTALKSAIDYIEPNSAKNTQARYQLSGEVDDVLSHTIGPTTYHRDDRLKRQILTHFRLNLERMIHIAHSANAKILLVSPAINLKDMSPFKSEHRPNLNDEEMQAWRGLFERGMAQQDAGEFTQALALYRDALALDDRYADLHYRIGQTLYALRRFDEAEAAFWRAVDEDIAPLRALPAIVKIVEDTAAHHAVPLVDYPQILREAYARQSSNSIFGNEYFIDHVHPTIEGYRLLGLALLTQLSQQGLLPAADFAHDERIAAAGRRVMASIEREDHVIALRQLGKVFNWAGKHEEARNAFMESIKVKSDEALTWSLLAKNALRRGKPEEAIEHLRQAVTIDPSLTYEQQGIAYLLVKQGRKAEALSHYLASLQADPTDADTHHEVALLFAELSDTQAALHHFNESLRLKPDFENARYNLIVILIRLGKYDEALLHNRELLRINPNSYRGLDSLGVILATRGDYNAAIAQFNEALRIKPNYLTAQNNLQEALKMRKEAKTAAP